MATFPTTAPIEAEPTAGRDGGVPPMQGGGGGDGEPFSSGSGAFDLRLRRARLGMVVAMSGIAMIFVSFSSAYVVRQGLPTIDTRTGTLMHDWTPVPLPPLLLINTIVLLVSSLTMVLARRSAARNLVGAQHAAPYLGKIDPREPRVHASATGSSSANQISWLTVTIALGLAFLAGQIVAWRELASSGFYLNTSPSSSFVYLLTGMHGIHLLGGVLALLFAGVASLLRKSVASRLVILDVTGWYWHFMATLWIYIFCLMKFAH